MGNLVDCLKKAKRLNKYEKAAIRAAQQEYLPNAKTSAEADQMAVNSAIERVQDIISSIYQQAGVPQSRPVVVPASGPLAEPVTPTAVAAPAPAAQAPVVAPAIAPLTPESSREEIIAQLSSIPMFRGVRGENTKSPKGAQYFTSSEDFAKTYSPKGIVGEHRVTLRNPLIVSMADWSDYSSSSFNPIGPIEKSLRKKGYDGVVMISRARGITQGEPLITVLALNSEKTTTFAPAVAPATAVVAPVVAPAIVAPETKAISPTSRVNRQEQAKKLSLEEYKAWRLGDNPIPLFKDKLISEAIAILRETEGNNKYLDLIEYLISKFGGSNIRITSRDTILDTGTLASVGGFYSPYNNLIVLSRSSSRVKSYSSVLAHEFLHAITVKAIYKQEALNARDRSKEYNKLEKLYNTARNAHNLTGVKPRYGLTNLKEFISEAFSNQDFQEFLEGIPSENKGTLWSDFVDAIRAILGISAKDGSLLKEVLKVSEGIIKSQQSETGYFSRSYNSKEYFFITKLEDEYKTYRGELDRKGNIKRLGQGLLDLLESDDNPSVDPNKDQEALPSSAANGVTLDSRFFPPSGKKIKNSGVANLFKDVMSEFCGKVITSANVTQRELDIIIRNGVNEFKAAFADSKKSAADWYSTAVEVAMEVASLIHPELNNADVAKSIKAFSSAEDPVQAANLVMRMAMAITSQN